jgi:zinc protease
MEPTILTENHLTQTTLSNGLKVWLKEIHTAPIISSWLWYRVGSRDEVQGQTGISHWVEHMQFKGTPQFPSNVLDKAISREGGTWNAFTYMDWTAYFETMPADKIDLALRLESDRMINSQFDANEVASERTVIISEREGSENEPLFLLGEAIQQAAFRIHPYHHEVIGDMADLHTITRDALYSHYRAFYVPNNAVMAVAGDFDTQSMLTRIKELFEPIPSGNEPARLARDEPVQKGEVRLSVEGPGSTTYVQVCYDFPSASHPDFFPLSVLDSLVAGPSNLNMFSGGISNKTSRLYRALVDKEFAVSIHGGAQATIDPFLYSITMTVHPKRKPEEALAALDKEIQRIKEEKVSKEEITRAIKQARALFAYGSENITNQGFWLGYAEMFANYEWFQTYLDKLAAVTVKDIQRVANQYFKTQRRVVGTYIPLG